MANEYYWVPEDCMFKSGGDCLDKFPDLGAAALVVSHVAYDAIKAELEKYKNWVPTEPKPSEQKLSKEVNRLTGEVNRLQNLLDKARLLLDQSMKREEQFKKGLG